MAFTIIPVHTNLVKYDIQQNFLLSRRKNVSAKTVERRAVKNFPEILALWKGHLLLI